MTPTCSTCGSVLGFYEGPNGAPRCLNCFHDQDIPTAKEPPPPEPNKAVQDKAEASPKNVWTSKGTVRDKAVRGPKEPEVAQVPKGTSVRPSATKGTASKG